MTPFVTRYIHFCNSNRKYIGVWYKYLVQNNFKSKNDESTNFLENFGKWVSCCSGSFLSKLNTCKKLRYCFSIVTVQTFSTAFFWCIIDSQLSATFVFFVFVSLINSTDHCNYFALWNLLIKRKDNSSVGDFSWKKKFSNIKRQRLA